MATTRKNDISVHHTQGLEHRPFVFEEFSSARQASQGGGAFNPTPHSAKSLAEAAPEPEAAEPEVKGFSEEEMLAAQKEAEAIGHKKGRAEALAEQDAAAAAQQAQIASLLESLLVRIDAEVQTAHEAQEALKGQMAGIVMQLARKLAGKALETTPEAAVLPMIDECMAMLAGQARLSIVVAEEVAEPLQKHMAALQHQGQAIDVLADKAMQVGDCRIQWPGGKAERSQQELLNELEGIVQRALSAKKE
jgi:flagellar assembly protein FliH